MAAGAAILAGALLPWVEAFAGQVQVPGIQGTDGRILAAPAGSTSPTAHRGTEAAIVTIGFAVVFALVAVGVFVPVAVRPALVPGIVAALVIWVTSENFGTVLSGTATDLNTGPLLVLIALACWPARSRAAGARRAASRAHLARRSPSSSPW